MRPSSYLASLWRIADIRNVLSMTSTAFGSSSKPRGRLARLAPAVLTDLSERTSTRSAAIQTRPIDLTTVYSHHATFMCRA